MLAAPVKEPIGSYRDLRVYQQSMALLGPVHKFALSLPEYEKYALADQIRRAARSVPTNIVEGYSRRSSAREFKHFVSISMGSANEAVVHFEVCRQVGYGNEDECLDFMESYESIGKQLHMLMANWQTDGRAPTSNIQHPTSLHSREKRG
jgi:four helix bundle protein